MSQELEVEVKVLEANHLDLEKKIFELGGIKTFDEDLIAFRLDKDNQYPFGSSQLLRIRSEGDLVKITHKLKLENSKVTTCEETEITSTDSIYDVFELFNKLGYEVTEKTYKRRISYKINFDVQNYIKLDFDKYKDELEYIPEFLEIESNNKLDIQKGIEILGIDKSKITTYGLGDLKKIYKNLNFNSFIN